MAGPGPGSLSSNISPFGGSDYSSADLDSKSLSPPVFIPMAGGARPSPPESRSSSLQSAPGNSSSSAGDAPWSLLESGSSFKPQPSQARQTETPPTPAAQVPPGSLQLDKSTGMDEFKIEWHDAATEFEDQWDMLGFLKPEFDISGYEN